jgi:tellurite methyltransferase
MREERESVWDLRHATAPLPAPAEVLVRYRHWLPGGGLALDLACGLGANALLLAERGLDVHAWDVSAVALGRLGAQARERGLRVSTAQRDVVAAPPQPSSWDVIVCSRFLHRPLCPALLAALRPGGLLYVQTFTRLGERTGGPRNPEYLLEPGELLHLFAGLTPLASHDGSHPDSARAGASGEAWLVARAAGRVEAHAVPGEPARCA